MCSNEMKIRGLSVIFRKRHDGFGYFFNENIDVLSSHFCCCDAVTTKKKDDASKKKRNSRSAYEPVTYVKQMLLKRTTVATDTINIISNSTKFRCS